MSLFSLTAFAVIFYPNEYSHLRGGGENLVEQVRLEQITQHPKIEVVFALDITGSMGGMIQAAKEKIWSIATTLASAEPAPEISIGLVAYRDQGDAYLTKVIDLSSDLDSVFAQLMQFQAQGGGDTPEAVNQALSDAISKISWSSGQQAYQVVFLVGDAPAHSNEQNVVSFGASLKQASKRGILVNTIQCGDMPATRQHWQQIASLGGGDYLKVHQNGSAIASHTPFDEQLAALSKALDATRVFYDSKEVRQKFEEKTKLSAALHERASAAALTKRAEYNSTGSGVKNLLGESELLRDIAEGKVDISRLSEDLLPEPVATLSAAEKEAFVQEQLAKREQIQGEIKTLAQQRRTYMAAPVAELEMASVSLDYQLFDTLKKQAAKKGIDYKEEDLSL